MATASGLPDKQQRLLRLIECPICLNEIQDPRLLSCRHIYCYKCLKDYHGKGNHGNALPCPQCRQVTALCQGVVDNLPQFFFMNELKEVVITKDGVKQDKPQKHRGVCSTEDCGQPGVKYCKKCEFLCQQWYDDHSKSRLTKSHQAIPASEGEAFIKSQAPTHPSCHRHKHQVMDLYCRTCNLPICNTCSNSSHRSHECCELEEQAKLSKAKLEQVCKETDALIQVVKQVIDKTGRQIQEAEADIDGACDNVKSIFKIMHDKLNKEEKNMLANLQAARKRVKKTGDITVDNQSMTLANLESLQSCQVKLVDKDSPYDYVTVTGSLQRDVEIHFSQELSSMTWSSQITKKTQSGEVNHEMRVDILESVATENVEVASNKQVEVTGSVASDRQLKEVGRIRLVDKSVDGLYGMVVYRQRVYVAIDSGPVVYCYAPDGSLSHKYDHKWDCGDLVNGMCLMLVVSTGNFRVLIWIKITNDVTMEHYRTQQLNYSPRGLYNDRGDLLVCDEMNHKIHRYRHDGQKLAVIKLTPNVSPWWITRHNDGDHYVISDLKNRQVVIIRKKGQIKTCYNGDIHGVKFREPRDVITDPHTGVLLADISLNQVLLMTKSGDVVKILDQHMSFPRILYLDTDHHRLYVSGTERHDESDHVYIFNYRPTLLTGGKELTVKNTKLHMKVEI